MDKAIEERTKLKASAYLKPGYGLHAKKAMRHPPFSSFQAKGHKAIENRVERP